MSFYDIMIYDENSEKASQRLELGLLILPTHGLKLKTKKCYFFFVRCLRSEAYYAIFFQLDLLLTNQLQPVEEFTYEGLSE